MFERENSVCLHAKNVGRTLKQESLIWLQTSTMAGAREGHETQTGKDSGTRRKKTKAFRVESEQLQKALYTKLFRGYQYVKDGKRKVDRNKAWLVWKLVKFRIWIPTWLISLKSLAVCWLSPCKKELNNWDEEPYPERIMYYQLFLTRKWPWRRK